MAFDITPNVLVRRDNAGNVCQINHLDQPYRAREAGVRTRDVKDPLRKLTDRYVRDVLAHYQIDSSMLTGIRAAPEKRLTDDPVELRFDSQKTVLDITTISYAQTCFGIQLWKCGFVVQVERQPMQVIGAHSSICRDVKIRKPAADAAFLPERIDPKTLLKLLNLDAEADLPELGEPGLYIYRYVADRRFARQTRPSKERDEESENDFRSPSPTLPLPSVARSIEDGKDYVVSQTRFTLVSPEYGEQNWTALVEVETGSVLYLRAHVAYLATGMVFLTDPVTKTGDTSLRPDAGAERLDAHRDEVTLPGLTEPTARGDYELRGEFVQVVNIDVPDAQPPRAAPPGEFHYSATTDDFSAVNSYYHCDRLFRLMEDMGFDVHTYFDGTTFPIRVDHRVRFQRGGRFTGDVVNACAPGNPESNGSDGFRFALAQLNTSVGSACSWRLVLHEFGHALLWDHVDNWHFGFAHSAGDSLAAILNDPDSKLRDDPERFRTFPWVQLRPCETRFHNRLPDDGWAFGDSNNDAFSEIDLEGYNAEQVLSSTMFRIYQSAGGDSASVEERRFAAHYITFLIIKSIGLLTPTNDAAEAEDYADVLMQADRGSFLFRGDRFPAGVLRKVIRWGFERQGAYQPPGTRPPIRTAGDPPAVDLYINDGRDGQYEFLVDHTSTPDVWVRHQADGQTEHQNPETGQSNFVYARIKNRGTQAATSNVRVAAYQTDVPVDQTWPTDWRPFAVPRLSVPGGVAAGDEEIVGPFEFQPVSNLGSVLMIVQSDGDLSNAMHFTAKRPIPNRRLVPYDNNIAQRRLSPSVISLPPGA